MKVRFMERIPVLTRAEIARLTLRCPPVPAPRKGRREPMAFFRRRVELHHLVEARDRALIALVHDIPLRGGEPALLELRDYDEVRGEIDIRGGKWQSEPVSFPVLESTKAAMALYLDALRRSRWADTSPALFPPLGVRRADTKRPASGIGYYEVYRILKRRIARAGIEPRGRRLSVHVFRYTRATHWKEEGVPIDDISVLLRHKKIETTRLHPGGPLKRTKRRADCASLFRRVNFEIPPE